MKRYLYSMFVILTTFLLLVGCGTDDEPEVETLNPTPETETIATNDGTMKRSNPSGDTWTVLVYLCGTDLETMGGYASFNLEETAAADPSDKINFIIQTGGTSEWAISDISPDELQRFELDADGLELVDSQPLASMGDSKTFGQFLSWGVKTYPADKYMCLMWNHGGGSVTGIAFDELYGFDSLDLREMADGFDMANTQFELVGFDACLMSTLETASALTPYSRYMVASQELEPGTGWDYTTWVSELSQNPTMTGDALGTIICDSFYDKCADGGMGSLVTLSVTDLSKIPTLVQDFDNMAAEMKGFTASPEKLQPLTQAIVKAENYGGNNDSEGYTNMVDLGDMVLHAQGILPNTGETLLNSLDDAVVYQVSGNARQKSNGLSVYVPLMIADNELDDYANLAAVSGEYLRFFEGLYDWKAPSGVVLNRPTIPTAQDLPSTEQVAVANISVAEKLNQDDYKLESELFLTDEGEIVLDISSGSEIISTVAFNLFYYDEESDGLWYLGSDYDVNSDDEGTQYWDNFRNVWTIINDNLCMMEALSLTDDYILYTVPVAVNGTETNLRMLYHYDTAEYEVIGTWDGIDEETGMSSRDVMPLSDGDEVELLFVAADMETLEVYDFVGGSFTVDGSIVAEEAELFDGVYYYQYTVTDIFGNEYESDFAEMVSLNGEITVSLDWDEEAPAEVSAPQPSNTFTQNPAPAPTPAPTPAPVQTPAAPRTLVECQVLTDATTTQYKVGDKFKAAEVSFRLVYSDGTTEDIYHDKLKFAVHSTKIHADYAFKEAGDKTVVVTWGEYEHRFNIKVHPSDSSGKAIQSCTLLTSPVTLNYPVGGRFAAEEISLRVTYTDGSTQDITHESIKFWVDSTQLHSAYNFVQAGKKTVKVRWGDYKYNYEIVVK